MGEMVTFPSNGDTCTGCLTVPESGSGPGVVVIQEYWGLVEHIRDVSDRLAAEGFVALAPDLYPRGDDSRAGRGDAAADGARHGPCGEGHLGRRPVPRRTRRRDGQRGGRGRLLHGRVAGAVERRDGGRGEGGGRVLSGGPVGEAFFNDTRPEVYSPEHAQVAWRRTLDLLRTRL